jgi:hypothetical protein
MGPGELTSLAAAFFLATDTIALYDATLKRISLFVNGAYVPPTLDVSRWRRGSDYAVNIVGRFPDGRWLQTLQSRTSKAGVAVQRVIDTTWLMAGTPPTPPERLYMLPVRERVLVEHTKVIATFDVQDAAHFDGAVCDSGVVVVDSTGITRIDRNGRVTSRSSTAAFKTTVTERDRERWLTSALSSVPPGISSKELQPLLRDMIRGVAQVNPYVRIASDGTIWMSRRRGGLDRLSGASKVDYAFSGVNAVVAIGPERALTMSFDTATEVMSFNMSRFREVPAATGPSMGRCGAMFRW